MNFNIFKKFFSFSRSSFSSLDPEENTKIEEKKNNTEEVACKSPFIIPPKLDPNSFEEHASAFDEKIDVCKEHADPKKYFDLFAKHLKKFDNGGLGKKIALIDLSNVMVDKMIIDLNPKAEYVLIDNFLDYQLLKGFVPDVDLSLICTDDGSILEQFEELQKLNTNMKFDVVVGNPPYDRSLHLKILAEVMKHLSDEGEVVWLAPIRWLQDPLAKYKKNSDYRKYEDRISKHILSISILDSIYSNTLFSIRTGNLAIYFCTKEKSNYDNYSFLSKNLILDKVYNFVTSNNPVFETDKNDGWRVRIPVILGCAEKPGYFNTFGKLFAFFNGKKNGKWWYEFYHRNQCSKISENIPNSIKFNNENEAVNFINQFETKFGKYVTHFMKSDVHITPEKVLFMKDYTEPWTDERFYKYFNLTDDEIKLIEETIKD